MKIEILRYKKWDQTNGAYVQPSDLATRNYIARIRAEAIEGSRRNVEESLVDREGRAIVDPGTEEAIELKHLTDRGGILSTSGHSEPLRKLVDIGLVRASENGAGDVEYRITDLGHLAVREMML